MIISPVLSRGNTHVRGHQQRNLQPGPTTAALRPRARVQVLRRDRQQASSNFSRCTKCTQRLGFSNPMLRGKLAFLCDKRHSSALSPRVPRPRVDNSHRPGYILKSLRDQSTGTRSKETRTRQPIRHVHFPRRRLLAIHPSRKWQHYTAEIDRHQLHLSTKRRGIPTPSRSPSATAGQGRHS